MDLYTHPSVAITAFFSSSLSLKSIPASVINDGVWQSFVSLPALRLRSRCTSLWVLIQGERKKSRDSSPRLGLLSAWGAALVYYDHLSMSDSSDLFVCLGCVFSGVTICYFLLCTWVSSMQLRRLHCEDDQIACPRLSGLIPGFYFAHYKGISILLTFPFFSSPPLSLWEICIPLFRGRKI